MKRPILILLLALALQACNIPVPSGSAATPPPQAPPAADEPVKVDVNEALTLAVQTLAAQATPTVPSETPTQTFTAAPPTDTPIVGVNVTVSSDTNCREGPSTDYDIVMLFTPGMSAQVVGKYGTNYWIIEYPGGFGATCWLWGAYATVIGNTASLVEGVPPPLPPTVTPVAEPPLPPKQVHTSCSSKKVESPGPSPILLLRFEWTVKVLWKDNSNNEDGFNVYKDGALIGTVGANQTSYTYKFTVLGLILEPVTYVFAVQSFNSYGASGLKTVDLSTCP